VKKFRATFVALAIVLVLAAYMVFTGRENPATDMEAPMIFGVNSDTMRRIHIAHGDNEVTVEKDNDRTWVVDAPETYEISQEAVNALVMAIADAKFEKEVEDDPRDLEAFGLSSPDTSIVVEGDRRGKKALLVGSVTPVGSGYYVKAEDDTRVWVIPAAMADALIKTVDDLREKKIDHICANSRKILTHHYRSCTHRRCHDKFVCAEFSFFCQLAHGKDRGDKEKNHCHVS
jgi:hypothetical protein